MDGNKILGGVTVVEILSPREASKKIKSDSTVMIGGFGNVGNPKEMIDSIAEEKINGLTVIANDLGTPNVGLGRWLRQKQIKKAIGTYFTWNPEAAQEMRAGNLEVVLMPQGSFAEAIRAGGAGLGGFYTPVGLGTEVTEGHEQRTLDGKDYIFVKPLKADYALLHAKKADTLGNLVFEKTARNFNPLMAMAAKCTIVEVEEIVPAGELSPEEIVTPFIFVDILVSMDKEGAR